MAAKEDIKQSKIHWMQKQRQKQKRLIEMNTLLNLLKIDMGITHNLRDAFFIQLLQGRIKEIERRGITLEPITGG